MLTRSRTTRALLPLAIHLSLVVHAQAATPDVGTKNQAPRNLQAVFQTQDDTTSRSDQVGLKLSRRTVPLVRGIDSRLLNRGPRTGRAELVLMAMDHFPSAADWALFSSRGVDFVRYEGSKYWLVRVTGDLRDAFAMSGATAFVEFLPTDKIAVELDAYDSHDAFFDKSSDRVVVNLTFTPQTDSAFVARIKRNYHDDRLEFEDASSGVQHLTLVTDPSHLHTLAAMPEVVAIETGVWKVELLMDGVRRVARGEDVTGADGRTLTGAGVRAANYEGLGVFDDLNKVHEGFWNHDAHGEATTPRVTSTALASECWKPLFAGGTCDTPLRQHECKHAIMTAGVLLGNGWNSEHYSGGDLGFRGLAPEATFECYDAPGAHPHVSSHSYSGYKNFQSNAAVVGAVPDSARHHAHVIAAGNSGLSDGYRSLINPYKNPLIVGNTQVNGEIFVESSAGPTSDGRLKPDLSAPTGQSNDALYKGGYDVWISEVSIVRDGAELYTWNFESGTREGWGQTASILGRSGVDVEPFEGEIRLGVEAQIPHTDWGGWGGTPVAGTEVDANGVPLDFVGEEGDLLRVTYQAHDLGYFTLMPVWFRDHPYRLPHLGWSEPEPWHSQSYHGGVGIGDGTWRTLEVPIGSSGDWSIGATHPFWNDVQTWANEPIQFLGFRFDEHQMQPTPSFPEYYQFASGGTSGASPVLGGAYALAMENLTRLYPVTDLDERDMVSVYHTPYQGWGMPLNSTWKALFVHTADDMIRESNLQYIPPNPDTGAPTVYHRGPDYATGYGMVDIESAIGLMNLEAQGRAGYGIHESGIEQNAWHAYEVVVSPLVGEQIEGLKITMAWDDSPTAISVVNNLSLVVEAPDGEIFYPWSLSVPTLPITAGDIVPAQRDQPNDRDNIEQVVVDEISSSQTGTWRIHVTESGMGDPMFEQNYSLVVSPWKVDEQCHDCP